MGVKDLWPILEPTKMTCNLDDLAGTSVAVDLGFWICQMNSRQLLVHRSMNKIHLRNLFFRIHALLKRDIKPIFISEGKPPEIKMETIRQRLENKNSLNPDDFNRPKSKSVVRSRFNQLLKESCELIRLMGLQFFVSDGEAEALCAALNSRGLVEAVITDDNDAFLYGANKVYKNFNLDGKQPVLECYSSHDIENKLGLNRQKMIALALLLGCDYCPKGVPGVGKERALKFVQSIPFERNVLNLLDQWKNSMYEETTYDHEPFIRKRALTLEEFPQRRIIEEYSRSRNNVDINSRKVELNYSLLRTFLHQKLEWEDQYIAEKIIPIFTLKHLTSKAEEDSNRRSIIPKIEIQEILKRRIRNGRNCFEVRWSKLDDDIWTEADFYDTIEEENTLLAAYPNIVEKFVAEKLKVTSKKSKNKLVKNENKKNQQLVSEQPQIITDNSIDQPIIDFAKLKVDDEEDRLNSNNDRNNKENMVINNNSESKIQKTDIRQKFTFRKLNKNIEQKKSVTPVKDMDSIENSPLPFRERVARLLKLKNQENNDILTT
uniref:Chromo domain-containing protein n=1 Tax=Romanomermis culicivorax TaxID=13658 RepID=A0A915L2C5_ROMCU